MTKLLIFTLLGCFFFLTLIIYGLLALVYRKEKLDKLTILDQYTTDYYRDELDSIIQHRSIYYVDYRVGKLFSNSHSITTDIPNDELLSICNDAVIDILDIIPPKMYLYLEKVMGDSWLKEYVKSQTMSYVLNYSKVTIESLTIEKFGKE